MIENSYPTYVIKLNKICFDRCVRTLEIPKERDVGANSGFLTDSEESCIDECAHLYMRQLRVMTKNFEKRLCT